MECWPRRADAETAPAVMTAAMGAVKGAEDDASFSPLDRAWETGPWCRGVNSAFSLANGMITQHHDPSFLVTSTPGGLEMNGL